jgi:hypothetical protein
VRLPLQLLDPFTNEMKLGTKTLTDYADKNRNQDIVPCKNLPNSLLIMGSDYAWPATACTSSATKHASISINVLLCAGMDGFMNWCNFKFLVFCCCFNW